MIRKNTKPMKILSGMLTILTISSTVSLTPKTFSKAATVEKEKTSTLKKVKDFISKPATAMAIGAAVTGGAIFAALKLMSKDESQNNIPGPSINNNPKNNIPSPSINNDFSIRGIPNIGNSCYINYTPWSILEIKF